MHVALLITFMIVSSLTKASEDSPVILGAFEITSPGFERTGQVTVSGVTDNSGVLKLRVTAFGKEVILGGVMLGKLKKIHVNGIEISHDGGWGANESNIIIRLSTGYVSGIVDNRYVLIKEKGGVEIYESLGELMGR